MTVRKKHVERKSGNKCEEKITVDASSKQEWHNFKFPWLGILRNDRRVYSIPGARPPQPAEAVGAVERGHGHPGEAAGRPGSGESSGGQLDQAHRGVSFQTARQSGRYHMNKHDKI